MTAKKKTQERMCRCPYCDVQIVELNLPFCQGCGVAVLYCLQCKTPVKKGAKVCPQCGAPVK